MHITRGSRVAGQIATRFAVVLASALLIAACGGGGDGGEVSPEQEALDGALLLWADVDSTHYQFVSQRSCECLPEYVEPIIVEVIDGAIASALNERDLTPVAPEVETGLYTIDGLFTVIQEAIDDGAYSVDVSYDGVRGVPTGVNIDYDVNTADEEFYVDVRDFEVIVDVGF